jgi:LysM repeat protein
MKTAACLQFRVKPHVKPVISLVAAALVTFGIVAPLMVSAQDADNRTIATGSGIPLAANAPDSYTVKRGDTLWDISKVFLRDPWYWPEIWYLNQQVKNPHLIYPGDVLVLSSVAGKPQVTVGQRGEEGTAADVAADDSVQRGGGQRVSPRVRSTPISGAISTISYESIAAFLKKPTLMTKDQAKSGPYIVGMRDRHEVSGESNEVYARRLTTASEGARFGIVHVYDELVDPENGKVLGYRGIYVGQGTVTRAGDPAKLLVGATDREVVQGDRLFPEDLAIPLDFLPHAPARDVKGSIMAVSGVYVVGATQTVAINRGAAAGLDAGTVLAILKKGEVVRDHFADGTSTSSWASGGKKVALPSERVGLLMVFKAYEKMSYALIMESNHDVSIGDGVSTP